MKALVLGGGLDAAVSALILAGDGHQVTLIRPPPSTLEKGVSYAGVPADKSPRFVLGWHQATWRFMQRVGCESEPAPLSPLRLLSTGPARFRLPLPAPLDLFAGVASLGSLSFVDRAAVLRVVAAVRFPGKLQPGVTEGQTAEQWLGTLGQSERARRQLWEPLAQILVAGGLEVSAALLAQALRETLDSRVEPRLAELGQGWQERITKRADERLREAGVTIREGRIGAIVVDKRSDVLLVKGVAMEEGKPIDAQAVIAALDPATLLDLLDPTLRSDNPWSDGLAELAAEATTKAPPRTGSNYARRRSGSGTPRSSTPVEGLFLAGSFIRLGYAGPTSTGLEAALRSAEEAAALASSFEPPPPPRPPAGFVPLSGLVRHRPPGSS